MKCLVQIYAVCNIDLYNVGLRGTEQEAADMRTVVDGGIPGGGRTGGTIAGGGITQWAAGGAVGRCDAAPGVCRLCEIGDEFHDWTTSDHATPGLRQHTCQRYKPNNLASA